MDKSRVFIKLIFILLTGIELVICNHLPAHQLDYPEQALSLNQRFFNDVRSLIKRRLKENSAFQELRMDGDGVSGEVLALPVVESKSPKTTNVPTPVLVENWPTKKHNFGQVTAVSIDPDGNPVIFERVNRIWDVNSFSDNDVYNFIDNGPIREQTIHVLDPKSGAIKESWGEQMFYMPHGLTIDTHGNYWITDVAMHQAFKFRPFERDPVLVIGKAFKPGSSVKYLCKPTSVAVATTGEFFVADGYCNQRILKFNAAGRLLRTIPQPPEFLSLQVPHAITLLEHLDLLCIADRENMRVVCPKAGLKSSQGEGQPAATIQEPDLGNVYGVAAYGDIVFAVNGPTAMLPVRGFTIDPRSETIIGHWGEFKHPHSLAVSVNDSALYVTEIGTDMAPISGYVNHVWKYVLV